MEETQKRTGFFMRNYQYYERYWLDQGKMDQGLIAFAKHNGVVQAGAYIQLLGTKAWYRDGASTQQAVHLCAPSVLHWRIMQHLEKAHYRSYDLVGAPRKEAINSPLQGLVQFKSGFRGEFQEFIGTYDLPLSVGRYRLWRRFVEPAVLRLNLRLRGKLWY